MPAPIVWAIHSPASAGLTQGSSNGKQRRAGGGTSAASVLPTRTRHRQGSAVASSGNASDATSGDADQPTGASQEAAASSGTASTAGSTAGSSIGTSSFLTSPWELMGRVVNEQRIALQFDRQLNQGLIRSAAARASGLEYEEFEQRLQRLLALMPFLQERLLRMSPKLLAALAAEPSLMAGRLVELKLLLPCANVAAVVGGRPSLLLSPEWERLPAALGQLAQRYSEEEVARLVAAEPLLLAEDVEQVLAELQRLMPGQPAAAALLRQPSLASNVSRLSSLSLW